MVKKNQLLVTIFFLLLCLSSCKSVIKDNSAISITKVQPTQQELVKTSSDIYKIEGWQLDSPVNNGKAIVFWGSIFRNGTILSGMAMHASWPDPTVDGGIAHCDVQVSYGRGMCTIFTDHFTPGEAVPVSLTFEYNGIVYSGESSFIP